MVSIVEVNAEAVPAWAKAKENEIEYVCFKGQEMLT